MKGGRLFAMAGLYSTCTYTEGQKICTCAILTTSANDLVGEIHDRMPAIIDPGNYGQWLDAGFQSREELTRMLRPYPPDNMECFEVTRKVNSPSFDFPENILPVTGGDTERFPEG